MASLLVVNPKRKRRAAKAAPTQYKAAAPKRRRSRRLRRNPIASPLGGIARRSSRGFGALAPLLVGSGIGAAGGLALDLALKPLPLQFKTGPMGHLTRAALAIGAGMVGGRSSLIGQAAHGALTITLYQMLRDYVAAPMGLSEISEADMLQLSGEAGQALPLQGVDPGYSVGGVDPGYSMGGYGTPDTIGGYGLPDTY